MAATRLTGKALNGKGNYWAWGSAKQITTKLGEYEDTGLTPKQVRLLVDAVPELVRDIKAGNKVFWEEVNADNNPSF